MLQRRVWGEKPWIEVGVFDDGFEVHEEYGEVRIADGRNEIHLAPDAARRLAFALFAVVTYTHEIEAARASSVVSAAEALLRDKKL